MIRIRITYKKTGDIIHTSNLDLQRIWERSCRRAGLSISYSGGFHPQARIQQAAPLPLGFSSRTEIVDIWLEEAMELKNAQQRLALALPAGLKIIRMIEIDLRSTALQNIIAASEYLVELPIHINYVDLNQKIIDLLNTSALMIEKRGKTINIRERIETIDIIKEKTNGSFSLLMRLKQLPGLTGRPDDVLKAIGVNPFDTQIERVNLIFSSNR